MKIAKYLLPLVLVATFSACEDDSLDGDDGSANGDSQNSVVAHNQGQNCAGCHQPNSSISGRSVIINGGGSLYSSLSAANGTTSIVFLADYSVYLSNGDTNITFTESARGTGDFYTSTTRSDSNFTAYVILDSNGTVVKQSGNSHGAAKTLHCNSCHTSSGANGAPGRVVNQ